MGAGAVHFQREALWCDGCRAVVTHVRAVRASDRWHSDWICGSVAVAGKHGALRSGKVPCPECGSRRTRLERHGSPFQARSHRPKSGRIECTACGHRFRPEEAA